VRKRERQFNQAEELCQLLSARSGIPTLHALKRIRYTTTQTRLSREERMENLRGAFHAVQTAEIKGRDLVLVDDVFTTGSTVEECSRVLRRAGAASARVITIARG
jgi:ComF family protein